MKSINIYKIAFLFVGITMMSTSCKKWLDTNKDPNLLEQSKATVQLTLPTAEYTISYVLGNRYAELGGFLSQYWTQLPSATQYYDYDRYSFDAADANREWNQLYAGALKDLNFIVSKGSADGDSNYVAAAKVLQAYTFQLVSDVHGDVPFSEALQAQSGTLAPHYDKQKAIYAGCVKLIDDANMLWSDDAKKAITTEDVLFGGDLDMWKKFANTLKLKLAVRQSGANSAEAISILAELSGASFLEGTDVASIKFYEVKGNQNPLYASIQGIGVDNNVASKAIADSINGWGDPRAAAFFDEATFGGAGINGTQQGAAAFGGYSSSSPRSSLSSTVLGKTTPVILMSGWESKFLQSEAKANGWLAGGTTAQEDYEDAIVSNMSFFGIDTTGLDLFAAAPYAWDTDPLNNVQQIAIQKWVAFCGTQNMESWIELRRMGYPVLLPSKATQLGLLFPQRIPYVDGEIASNPNCPAQLPITDKMWWDIN